MARSIFKYRLKPIGHTVISIPLDSKMLKVAEQYGNLCAWFEVYDDHRVEDVWHFYTFGTGHELPDDLEAHGVEFFDTVLMHGGNLVIHVWAGNNGL